VEFMRRFTFGKTARRSVWCLFPRLNYRANELGDRFARSKMKYYTVRPALA
jgi:hypothetical protein